MQTLLIFVVLMCIAGFIGASKSQSLSPEQRNVLAVLSYCGLALAGLALFHFI